MNVYNINIKKETIWTVSNILAYPSTPITATLHARVKAALVSEEDVWTKMRSVIWWKKRNYPVIFEMFWDWEGAGTRERCVV